MSINLARSQHEVHGGVRIRLLLTRHRLVWQLVWIIQRLRVGHRLPMCRILLHGITHNDIIMILLNQCQNWDYWQI